MEVKKKPSKSYYMKNFLNLSFYILVQLAAHYFNIICNIFKPQVDKDISGQTALVIIWENSYWN